MASAVDVVNKCFENKPMAVMDVVGRVLREKVAGVLARERDAISKRIFNIEKTGE